MARQNLRGRVDSPANRRQTARPHRAHARAGSPSGPKRRCRGIDVENTALSVWQLRGQFPLSVGIDVVFVAEVAAALHRFGDRYVRRAFTAHEAAYCRAAAEPVSAARFAARFAAKEAALKALQPGGRWVDWRAIEVRRQEAGDCALVLHGGAASLARRRGIDHLVLSMSHEGDLAAAIVIAFRASNIHQPERRNVARDHR
jgi:holo-[acyl-carrier protein] synthase